jgi:hypothetical protein
MKLDLSTEREKKGKKRKRAKEDAEWYSARSIKISPIVSYRGIESLGSVPE